MDVIGNSTSVKIAENSGKVNYYGNSGKLYLGSNSKMNDVKYNGNDGQMKMMNPDNFWKNSKINSKTSAAGPSNPDKYTTSTNKYAYKWLRSMF